MARVTYNSTTTHGALLAEAVNDLIEGRAKLLRVYTAADVASNAGTVPTALEGGDFGADSGQGDDLWSMMGSIKGLLDADDAGGLAIFLSSLDNGG